MRIKPLIRSVTNNDYIFTILTKLFSVFIGLIASSFSNRFLGAELKGQLGSISSLLSVVAVTANFGLYQPYPFYKRNQEHNVLNKFLNIFAFQFFLYTLIGLLGATYFKNPKLIAVCLLAPIQVLANQLSFIIMVEDVKFKNITFFTARITNTLITVLAFYTMNRTLMVALALIIIGDIITITFTLFRLKAFPNPLQADLRFACKIIPFGLVSMVTTLMLTLNYRIDTLMMDYMYHIADREIGFYTLGVSLSEYGWLIPDAFREVLFSRTATNDALDEVTMSLKVNFYLTIAVILGILILGQPAIVLLAGREFLPAYPVTILLAFGIIPMSWFKIVGTLLLAQGKKFIYLIMLSSSVVVNVICNMVAIPIGGKMGAAAASVASYSVAGILFLGYYLKTYKIQMRKVFIFSSKEKSFALNQVKRVSNLFYANSKKEE